jgi:hypothetical protein
MLSFILAISDTYAQTINSIGIIGTATPNDWNDPDQDLTQSSTDPNVWTGTF